MSHIFRLSDEQYNRLAAYAAHHKQTPEKLFQAWVSEVTHKVEEPLPLVHKEQTGKEGRGEELQGHPLLEVAGMFAIGEPGWTDKHDEFLAETYIEKHDNA